MIGRAVAYHDVVHSCRKQLVVVPSGGDFMIVAVSKCCAQRNYLSSRELLTYGLFGIGLLATAYCQLAGALQAASDRLQLGFTDHILRVAIHSLGLQVTTYRWHLLVTTY